MGKQVRQQIAAVWLAACMTGWQCVSCHNASTYRRDKVCSNCRHCRRGRHFKLRPIRRLRWKQPLQTAHGTYGSLILADSRDCSGDHEGLHAFRRSLENELTDLVALVGHATAHSILAHAHCLLEGYAKKCKLPARTDAMLFGLIWFGTGLTAQFIEDEVELERKILNIKGLTRKDVGKAKAFWTNAMNVVDKFALGS